MSAKQIIRVASLLGISTKEAIIYCEEVRRASGFGTDLSYGTIARHLRAKKPPYPESQVLASIITQQESFRIRTGKRFTAPESRNQAPKVKDIAHQKPRSIQTGNITKRKPSRTPILDGIEVKSPDLAQELKRLVINEQGFLVSTNLIPETKPERTEEKGFHRSASSKNMEQSNIFDSIKALDANIPGARIKKLRPNPNQQVTCPVCHKQTDYQNLFDHVTKRHPEENAKFVLANFNRQYEIWAKKNSNRRSPNKN
jgi:hypothetical protein